MTRYSREEIQELLKVNHFREGLQTTVVTQLLEENRIFREGFVKITKRPPAYAGKIPIMSHVEMIERAKQIEDIAYETLSKADEVGKEK